ncbi:ribosome modulation factor [Cupriavidus metallidurans]|uniref:ribosome modulation factor n=1 Tax=Cupriavidus metallidurans TaxID=119219 RepID=UPI001CCD16CF|nr:hypothetical protein LAI70_09520 [Cupriavidus metallidurans]
MIGHSGVAWRRGYDAALAGDSVELCPYALDSRDARAWMTGWVEGDGCRRDRMHVKYRWIDNVGGRR